MFELRTRVTGTEEVLATLEDIEADALDLRPAFNDVVANLRQTVGIEQFVTRGAALGTPWPPYDPDTLRSGTGPGMLVRTGRTQRSFLEGSQHVEKVETQSMEWGSAHFLARLHQTGTSRMPARPILALDAEAVERLVLAPIRSFLVRSKRERAG